MPSWNELLDELEAQGDASAASKWMREKQVDALKRISSQRDDRNVLLYASGFLQKPQLPGATIQLTHEEINGFMSVTFGMDWDRGLTLVLHTPGGVTNAAETIVEYIRSKFPDFEVIVPTYAMSAGTMISLASDQIIMGKQSQLGPIDPQMAMGGRFVSARAIVDQFEQAKRDVLTDRDLAHVWAPVVQTLGPALLQEAENALTYGESMVARWLEKYMFGQEQDRQQRSSDTAAYFNDATQHKSHGRRIDRTEARGQGVLVEDLESDQVLEDAVLTAYHLATLTFEKSPATKFLMSHQGRMWLKNWQGKSQ